ncbi:hypothetical protein BBR47_54100 [Brevibacillus brevis NBRC 100599]|uniref:Uncharacterized protein n=1 Tax=Brevibacillus brevis (strain 47 / JCM 6285 / NBRC 100599) TaxID=358681 RepID=C0Z738_BREBN|nr:hypothetical protein BBR47_54100 [Brevibacillus brevis NBRC 100599]
MMYLDLDKSFFFSSLYYRSDLISNVISGIACIRKCCILGSIFLFPLSRFSYLCFHLEQRYRFMSDNIVVECGYFREFCKCIFRTNQKPILILDKDNLLLLG